MSKGKPAKQTRIRRERLEESARRVPSTSSRKSQSQKPPRPRPENKGEKR